MATGKDLQFDKTNPVSLVPLNHFNQILVTVVRPTESVMGGIVPVLHNAAWSPIQPLVLVLFVVATAKQVNRELFRDKLTILLNWRAYTFSLDVIIGDSWDGEFLIIEIAPVLFFRYLGEVL